MSILLNIFYSYIVLVMKDVCELVLFSCIILFTVWSGSLFLEYPLAQTYVDIDTKAEKVLRDMSIEEKVGQLFTFGFWGFQPTQHILTTIHQMGLGGVIMMGYNIESEEQVKQLISDLKSVSKYPLLIAVDQEGGTVARIKFDDTYDIPQYEIDSEQEGFYIAQKRGNTLKNIGFNLNYSPVLDNISNSDSFLFHRAFRKSQEDSSKLAISMINGYHSAGILSCIKHFPGHADTTLDSHSTLDSVYVTKEELNAYMYQFIHPLNYSDAVMVGHLLFPLIEDGTPTSVSEYFLTTILRNDLGFDGLVITDDMQMKSIYDRYTIEEASVKAIKAGNDILVYIGVQEEQIRVYNAVLSAVITGDISEKELNEKVLRILQYKYSLE